MSYFEVVNRIDSEIENFTLQLHDKREQSHESYFIIGVIRGLARARFQFYDAMQYQPTINIHQEEELRKVMQLWLENDHPFGRNLTKEEYLKAYGIPKKMREQL